MITISIFNGRKRLFTFIVVMNSIEWSHQGFTTLLFGKNNYPTLLSTLMRITAAAEMDHQTLFTLVLYFSVLFLLILSSQIHCQQSADREQKESRYFATVSFYLPYSDYKKNSQ